MNQKTIDPQVARSGIQREIGKLLDEGKIKIVDVKEDGEPIYYPTSDTYTKEISKRIGGALRRAARQQRGGLFGKKGGRGRA